MNNNIWNINKVIKCFPLIRFSSDVNTLVLIVKKQQDINVHKIN